MANHFKIKGNLVDVLNRRIFQGELEIDNGKIISMKETNESCTHFILPGFIDSHVHIESSMLLPSEFARAAVIHGTVATVSDPHEIANVLGKEGVNFMINNGNKIPFKFFFGAPSCVPATKFETAGDEINADGVDELLARPEILYLSEMMNYPGVIYKDAEVLKKLASAKKYGKPIDGHAPGLSGGSMENYFSEGISTDHECFTYEEGFDKADFGVNILIREGSAAKNFEALIPLMHDFPEQMMFCSDDKHPDDLIQGHINLLVKRALDKGFPLFDVLNAACVNPVKHYKLPVGLLQEGDPADFIVVSDLQNWDVLQTYIDGKLVSDAGKTLIESVHEEVLNRFSCSLKNPEMFQLKGTTRRINVIEAHDGQLVTDRIEAKIPLVNGFLHSDIEQDILKMCVVNRYKEAPIAMAFIKNFGLKEGAIASCVGHDSHNITAVGTNDEDLCKAVNLVIENKGGISFACSDENLVLPLPFAGIMTGKTCQEAAEAYTLLSQRAKRAGSSLNAPFMTLSFMALLVIPKLKLSDLGLFDGEKFEFRELEVEG